MQDQKGPERQPRLIAAHAGRKILCYSHCFDWTLAVSRGCCASAHTHQPQLCACCAAKLQLHRSVLLSVSWKQVIVFFELFLLYAIGMSSACLEYGQSLPKVILNLMINRE